MYCRDDYIFDKIRMQGIDVDKAAEYVGLCYTGLDSFLKGRASISKQKFEKFVEYTHLTRDEIEDHIEILHKDKWAKKLYPKIQERGTADSGWWARKAIVEENRRIKRKEMQDSLEAKVNYCRRVGITYGELQRRLFFKEVVLTKPE